jgi:hypothetical protein
VADTEVKGGNAMRDGARGHGAAQQPLAADGAGASVGAPSLIRVFGRPRETRLGRGRH